MYIACLHTSTRIYAYIYIYMHMQRVHANACSHTFAHTFEHTRAHTQTHTFTFNFLRGSFNTTMAAIRIQSLCAFGSKISHKMNMLENLDRPAPLHIRHAPTLSPPPSRPFSPAMKKRNKSKASPVLSYLQASTLQKTLTNTAQVHFRSIVVMCMCLCACDV